MPDSNQAAGDLEHEGAVLAGYLLARLPAGASGPARAPQAAAERYAGACRRLFPEAAPPEEVGLLRFACRHPRFLPCLDAAAGLILPGALLRKKLILMLAILETMPEMAGSFLPAARPRHQVVAGLVLTGAGVAFKTLGGLVLLPLARWSR